MEHPADPTACDDGTDVRLVDEAPGVIGGHEADLRLTRALETMPAAFFALDPQWRFSYVNARAERLLQPVGGGLVGQVFWETFPDAVGSPVEAHYRHAVSSGETVTFESYHPPPVDAWFEVLAWPGPDGLAVSFHDITDRRRQHDRLQLLAAVTAELTGTMQADQAVGRLARLVVPALGDWCIVTLVDHDEAGRPSRRSVRDVGWWHRDTGAHPLVEAYTRTRIPSMRDESFLLRALATGRRLVRQSGATGAVRSVLQPGEAHELIAALAPESFVVLPLRGRGRTVGLLTVFNGADRAPMTPEELSTAAEVAGRAGMALDNARLYRQQWLVAEALQRSLLTAPPEPDHAEIAVRYVPAAEAAAVGGDWYDAFLQADGATTLVIGDVAGHDIAAAATMGQLRGLLRGIATSNDDIGPADVLSRLDSSMALLDLRTLATATIARFEQDEDERRRGVTRMRWCNAGHPPPLVLSADGTVLELVGRAPELLLGVRPATSRTEGVVTLDRGATVLMYTDGLIERRDSDLDAGLAHLRQALADLGGLPLQELCDQLLQRLVDGRPDDDVALVAIRLHPQDRPRPAEAGPEALPRSFSAPPPASAG